MTDSYTNWERRQHAIDCGQHAVKAQAFIRLGLIIEYDQDAPPPTIMTHTDDNGKVVETLRGCAALPSAGDEAGCAAVDKFAVKHHVPAGWDEGRYRAVIHLGGGYRYEAFYTPARTLYGYPQGTRETTPQATEASAA